MVLLKTTIDSLARAIVFAKNHNDLESVHFVLIDNGDDLQLFGRCRHLVESAFSDVAIVTVDACFGHGNVGFGRGHNLGILSSATDYYLVLNPDILMAEDAIQTAIRYLEANRNVGLLAPSVMGVDGKAQFLIKRYPSILVLALRGFAPSWFRQLFMPLLNHYEMRDHDPEKPLADVEIASGCFMFFRREILCAISGFSSAYFLYFEDFDISLRVGKISSIEYVPAVRVVHYGGGAARKGWRHILMFLQSAFTFFQHHGWKWR